MATATDQPTLVRAQVRHLRCSARKARVILDHVRGMSVMQAQATLQFSPRAAARDVLGLLKLRRRRTPARTTSIDQAELVIDHCYADEDRTLKRFKPRARGRASRIHKRMCHVTIVLRHVARGRGARHLRRSGHDRRRERPPQPRAPRRGPTAEAAGRRGGGRRGGGGRGDRAPKRKPAARKPKAEPQRRRREKAAAPEAPRKPRAAEGRRRRGRAEAAAPKAPRKKPAAKPAEPARWPLTMRPRQTADEGDS